MKKNGFTLSELVICLGIMAVLIGAGMSTYKSYDKGIKHLYSNTYYVLDRALYNSTSFWVTKDPAAREPFKKTVKDPETGVMVSVNDTEGTRRLCRALVEYINPVQTSDRDSASLCSASKAVTDMGTDSLFTDANVQFTATNGVRFWISKRYPSDDNKMKFFIIYADLNGVKRPNTMHYEPGTEANEWKTRDPDIFAFAALDNGRICPIGIPEVETRYMSTRIVYQVQGEGNDIMYRYSEPSKSLVASKAEAWGYYLPASKRQGKPAVLETDVVSDDPLSFNGYVKSELNSASKIYEFLNGQTMDNYVLNDPRNKDANGQFALEFKSALPQFNGNNIYRNNTGGYSCFWMSDEECYVLVDKYVD